jgi:hypothetical protein
MVKLIMALVWDYDRKELERTEAGRLLLLERLINFGPQGKEKIPLSEVRKNWRKLNVFPKRRKLLKLLIWGRTRS